MSTATSTTASPRSARRHGIDGVNLLGICEGGVFTTCYAALHPEQVKNLVLTITPIDFHADQEQERLEPRLHQSLDPQPDAARTSTG